MAKLGYEVTIFEKQDEPGGILLYGIPAFRLSKEVVHREINRLKALGVKFECNTVIGPDKTIDSLFEEGYDAIFIATGTHVPWNFLCAAMKNRVFYKHGFVDSRSIASKRSCR